MVLQNDTRGWIMTCVSAIACVAGSSIICVDLLIQRIPGKRHFRIQDSNIFLSSSLSLTFGVMLFSSLYSMLPAAKTYLIAGKMSPQAAAYTIIGCFLGGVIVIQAVSRFMHHYIPSHVVDCDHSHEDDDHTPHEYNHSHKQNGVTQETTPLLSGRDSEIKRNQPQRSRSTASSLPQAREYSAWRSSLQNRLSKQMSSLVLGSKASCNEDGPCLGFSDPCGQECFTGLHKSSVSRDSSSRRPNPLRTATAPISQSLHGSFKGVEEDLLPCGQSGQDMGRGREGCLGGISFRSSSNIQNNDIENNRSSGSPSLSGTHTAHDGSHQHHHHVPTNTFLAIGLQTCMAIALHKLPEGFITFATNHANPQLGFAVFMALFIHNITEGFALALPLYLALGSRWKSMFWSSLLGGLSQPLGAGAAALWFKLAGRGDMAPGDTVYGCMFAVTAGVMTSVALQLFSESLSLTHSRQLCITFAFIGMGILGVSFALTAS